MIALTKGGYAAFLLAFLAVFTAGGTGSRPAALLAAALLSALSVSWIFGQRNLHQIDIALEFPREIYANMEFPVGVQLTNRTELTPACLLTVMMEGREVLFPLIGMGAPASGVLILRFETRGCKEVGEVLVHSTFPFGLLSLKRTIPLNKRVTVFPKPQGCRVPPLTGRLNVPRGEAPSNVVGYEGDLISIRNYVTGDPLKYISWKSTAKTGVLKTRELSSTQPRQVMIDLDRMDKADVESTLSCVTFTVMRLIRSGIPVGLVIAGETFKPGVSAGHRLKLLTKLACYDPHG